MISFIYAITPWRLCRPKHDCYTQIACKLIDLDICRRMVGELCNEQCWKEGIIYAANCNRCFEEQIDQVETVNRTYIGESSSDNFDFATENVVQDIKDFSNPDVLRNRLIR